MRVFESLASIGPDGHHGHARARHRRARAPRRRAPRRPDLDRRAPRSVRRRDSACNRRSCSRSTRASLAQCRSGARKRAASSMLSILRPHPSLHVFLPSRPPRLRHDPRAEAQELLHGDRRDDRRDVPDRGRLDRRRHGPLHEGRPRRQDHRGQLVQAAPAPEHPDGRRHRRRAPRMAPPAAHPRRRRRRRSSAALRPDVLWATESSRQPARRVDRTRKPRRTQCSTVSRASTSRSRRWASSKGRLFSPQEYSLGTPVVVIGQDVADHFFPNLDPIGRAAARFRAFRTRVDRRGREAGQRVRHLDRQVRHRARYSRRSTAGSIRTASIDSVIVQAQSDERHARGDGGDARGHARAPPPAPVAAGQLRARDVGLGARVLEQDQELSRRRRHRAARRSASSSARSSS